MDDFGRASNGTHSLEDNVTHSNTTDRRDGQVNESVRASNLPWQQRPLPGDSANSKTSLRNDPSLGGKDIVTAHGKDLPSGPNMEEEKTASKSQIIQSLGSKSPEWFRQPESRASASAAYRKNREESGSDSASWSRSVRLPGMTREDMPESRHEKDLRSPTHPSIPASREGSFQEKSSPSIQRLRDPANSATTLSNNLTPTPLPSRPAQSLERHDSEKPPSLGSIEASTGRGLAMSPSQGRLSPERLERPSSPTKGLGGFVQSAMMKRSDSVNKRWSATAGPGLQRGNSVRSSRGVLEGVRFPIGGATPLAESRNSISRESTPTTNSRPASRHSDEKPQAQKGNHETMNSEPESVRDLKNDGISLQENAAVEEMHTSTRAAEQFVKSPPTSPSKRWSPSKASWLENAISKPESPKIISPALPQQPSWMINVNKAKQDRSSVDLARGSAFKEVSTSGLLRSPPLGIGQKPSTLKSLSSDTKPSPTSTSVPDESRGEGESRDPSRENSRPSASDLVDSKEGQDSPSISKAVPTSSSVTSQVLEEGISPPAVGNDKLAPQTKVKPTTPPKKDFRSGLKPRPNSIDDREKVEPEFRNVFGKLKKTQTQNYVAPDDFRSNILRGKAGLATTGGPKKSEIKDEFRESILNKKQGMVAPSASTRITSASSKNQERIVPEALAKRKDLVGVESEHEAHPMSHKNPVIPPEGVSGLANTRAPLSQSTNQKQRSGTGPFDSDSKGTANEKFASSLAGVLQRGPPTLTKTAPAHMTPMAGHGSDEKSEERSRDSPLTESGHLVHATKSRARGPKRKPPTSIKIDPHDNNKDEAQGQDAKTGLRQNRQIVLPTASESEKLWSAKMSNDPSLSPQISKQSKPHQPITPRKPSTPALEGSVRSHSPQPNPHPRTISSSVKQSPPVKEKPVMSPVLLKPNNFIPQSPPGPKTLCSGLSAPVTKNEIHEKPNTNTEPDQTVADGQPLSTPDRQNSALRLPAQKHNSPIILGKDATSLGSRISSIKPDGVQDRKVLGLGIQSTLPASTPSKLEKSPASSLKSPRSPPLPGKKPVSLEARVPGEASSSRDRDPAKTSPSKLTPGADHTFADVFDEPPKSSTKIHFDTQAVLDECSTGSATSKVQTLRKQIFEIVENGKQVLVPAHQEHILYEDSLYLCAHVFGTLSGTRTAEIYLWYGDGVTPSAVEDAHLFGKKLARDHNGKLIPIRQGKETSNLFQALGGIVITRRGSGRRSGGSANPHILRGRRHLGQIAFDEVHYGAQSICAGFPHVIFAPNGKVILWKGKGASADELGCARLIGMDLGVTGEIEEIEEGEEPDQFWNLFSDRLQPSNPSPPWHLKASCNKYTTRLFAVDAEPQRPKSSSGFMSWGRRGSAPSTDANTPAAAQIRGVVPFAQSDLDDDTILFLDTFFESFV